MENLQETEYVQPYQEKQVSKNLEEKQSLNENEKVIGVGKRKACSVTCILKPGKGVVTVNKEAFIRYFPCPMDRRKCLKSMEIAGIACEFDIDFLIYGGGTSA